MRVNNKKVIEQIEKLIQEWIRDNGGLNSDNINQWRKHDTRKL